MSSPSDVEFGSDRSNRIDHSGRSSTRWSRRDVYGVRIDMNPHRVVRSLRLVRHLVLPRLVLVLAVLLVEA